MWPSDLAVFCCSLLNDQWYYFEQAKFMQQSWSGRNEKYKRYKKEIFSLSWDETVQTETHQCFPFSISVLLILFLCILHGVWIPRKQNFKDIIHLNDQKTKMKLSNIIEHDVLAANGKAASSRQPFFSLSFIYLFIRFFTILPFRVWDNFLP